MTRKAPHDERLVFDGALTVRNIATVQSKIVAALQDHATVQIDCGAAAEIDLSFVQLLLAARKSAVKRGKSFSLCQPASGVLRDALMRSGFLPAVEGASGDDAAFWLKGANPA